MRAEVRLAAVATAALSLIATGAVALGTGPATAASFGPAPERPTTYPAALPFIADRAVVTTESPDGSMSTGARWVSVDAGALAEQVVGSSVADGWDVLDGTRLSRSLPVPPHAVLRRGGVTRMVTTVVEPGLSIVQLTDVKE